ncbi:hypothetical protein C923_00052 [Plasmodium falciparum UGT5.1]|uniref:BRCT domain-containing protein n=1 Tax=Plasmodium falciparum UGT5.1 TaxID=1237627 RepID=W7JK34_PLAFA|nr:hypothetical protein C923_00052 [Plasmodium falciparum UGT5.1]
MRSKYYKEEENKGFIKTHYFRKIDTEKIDKKLISLENNFNGDDVYLDIVIHDKERNNFDFFLMRITESSSVNNSLDAWNHIDITNIYNYILYDNKYCSDIINEKKGYLILKLKYTNENNIITSYFKVHCRNTKWENDKKVWHIPLFYIFEMSKLTLFLGGTVSDTVLYYLCKLFHHFSSIKNVNSNVKMNELSKDQLIKTDEICDTTHKEKKNNDDDNTDNYHNNKNNKNNVSKDCNKNTTNEISFNLDIFIKENKLNFIEYIKNVRMFRIEHIIINNIVKGDTMYIKIIPYNEDIVTKIKQTNFIQWNRTENILLIKKSNFKNFYINIIKGFNFKLCSYYDYFKLFRQKIMENDSKSLKGNFSVTTNITINTEYLSKKFNKRKMDFHNIEEEITDKGNVLKHSKKKKKYKNEFGYESTDSCNSDELSNNVDSSYYEGRELVNKIKLVGAANNYYKEVIYNKLHKIKHLRPPNYTYDPKGLITKNGAGTKGIEIFDMPSDINEWNKISFCIVPNEKKDIDLYDPKILCSLVSDVYLLKEKALDIILKNYKKWPEYTDVFWNTVCSENEFIVCNKNFNTRQKLAHDRLFNKQYFYIFNMESIKHSNYYNPLFLCKVLITLGEGILVQHPYDAEYIIISNSNDFNAIQFYNYLHEKKKKKKLPLFVTPKFIYDCILNYSISYPSKNKNHFAFSS